MAAIKHILVYWDKEGLTSIVKDSQLVEPSNIKAGTKAKIKWGRKILLATVIDLGSKAKMKRRQAEYLGKRSSTESSIEVGIREEEGRSIKKRRVERKSEIKSRKKEMNILRVTSPSGNQQLRSPESTGTPNRGSPESTGTPN